MKKYVKLEDVKALLKKLYNEHQYQHTGETYYAGIAAVDVELDSLPTIEVTEPVLKAEWIPTYEGFLGTDYRCSNCGQYAEEGNDGHFNRLTEHCSRCGYKMKVEDN